MIIETTPNHASNRAYLWPCVYHGNGVAKNEKLWNDLLKEEVKTNYKEQHPKEHDITVFTWSIPEESTILEECFNRMGIKDSIIVIPISKPFNWLDKIKKLREYLKYVKTKYVMALDATDIIVSTDNKGQLWKNIVNVFNNMGCEMVWNAEKNSWPSSTNASTLREKLKQVERMEDKTYRKYFNSEYCHLNSGAFIGKTNYVKVFYEKLWTLTEPYYGRGVDEMLFGGDQGFVRLMQLTEFPRMIIDYECRIFQTLNRVNKNEVWIHE